MYKYLQTKDINKKHTGSDAEETDEAEEEFANEAIQKEMTRLQSGAGKTSDSEEDMEGMSYTSESEQSKNDDDFFSDEENLKDVNMGSEGSDGEGEFNDDPGSDYDSEEEDIDEGPQQQN